MKIKVAGGLPFRFHTPYGEMEVTSSNWELKETRLIFFYYAAVARPIAKSEKSPVKISPLRRTAAEIIADITTGMYLQIEHHEPETYEFRVLEALSKATGVTIIE